MVATFPDISPDLNSQRAYEPKILRAEFGDGYFQAAGDGIHPFKETWSLAFGNRPKSEIDAIQTLLETLNGVQSFYWTPPGETPLTPNPKRWFQTGQIIGPNKNGPDAYSISFTIERTWTI